MEVFSKTITTKIIITEEERNFLRELYQTVLNICDENYDIEYEATLDEVIEDLIENGSFSLNN